MNEPHDFLDMDCRIDRLVDGELTGDEYRELLVRLEQEDGGWRRCAMAFLEAQAWEQEFNCLRQTAEAAKPVARPAVTVGRSVMFLAAIAASFLLAFGLGNQFQQWWGTPGDLVQDSSTVGSEPISGTLVDNRPPQPTTEAGNGQPLGLATFVVDGDDGSSKEVDVPVFQVNDAYGQAVLEDSTNVPPHIERALEKLGYEVRRDLHWAPVELKEGGQIIVPYGQVEITPGSRRSFH